ncbi:MAG TPA: PAS domain S-box protein, partial [Polyangiaceae bacterium]
MTTREPSAELLLAAADAANVGLWGWDLGTHELLFSPNWRRQLGFEPSEVSDDLSECERRVHPEDLRRVKKLLADYLERPWPDCQAELRVQHKDGAWHWLRLRANRVLDERGQPSRLVVGQVDITQEKRAADELAGVARATTERERAAEALRASEGRYRTLFEESPVAVWEEDFSQAKAFVDDLLAEHVTDLAAHFSAHPDLLERCLALVRFTDANQAAIDLLGARDKREALGGLSTLFTPEAAADFGLAIGALCTGQATRHVVDSTVQTLRGERRRVTVVVSVSPGHEQTLSRVLVSLIDISEQKRAEESLRESELKYRTIFEESFDGLFITSPAGRILDMNRKGVAMFGYDTKEEVQRLDLEKDVYAEPPDRKRILAMVEAQGTCEYDVVVKKKNGQRMAAHCSLTVARDERGVIQAYRGIIRDVTEKMRADEALHKLSRAVEQSPVSIMITDTHANIEYVNPKFAEVTGYGTAEVLGRNPRILRSAETARAVYEEMWRMLTAGVTWRGELHNRRKNGEFFWQLCTISPITDPTGKVTHYLAVNEDVTERKQLEDQLRQAQKMEAVGLLAGGIAHDFNNMLAVIQMQSSLLLERMGMSPQTKEGLREIIAATDRASNLTRQLLTFSRRQVAHPVDLDVRDTIGTMIKLLRRVLGEDVALETRFAPHLPLIHADPGMMEQVLMNLAVNARDAMPQGGRLTVSLEAVTVSEEHAALHLGATPGPHVCLSVADAGCGIPAEDLPRIFEPFFTTKGV